MTNTGPKRAAKCLRRAPRVAGEHRRPRAVPARVVPSHALAGGIDRGLPGFAPAPGLSSVTALTCP